MEDTEWRRNTLLIEVKNFIKKLQNNKSLGGVLDITRNNKVWEKNADENN